MDKHLLPISGSKTCALSSVQPERHNVTSWWTVAFTGVMAGSTAKWSKQFNKLGTHKESNREHPHLNSILPSSKACSSITRLRLWLPTSTGPGFWPDNGTRRRVMTACVHPLMCFTSASLDTSPASKKNLDHHSLHLEKKVHIHGRTFAKIQHFDATNLTEFPWEHQ